MDISTTTAPRSDQQNYDDYIAGEKTLTITEVRAGNAEQPVEIHLAEYPGRPYKPSKSMRRVLVAAWGADADAYAGRRITLYGDPTVKFGGNVVGGIKISGLSHIDKPLNLALTETRGKKAKHTVQPIATAPATPDPADYVDAITAADTIDTLKAAWQAAADVGIGQHPDVLAATNQRKGELAVKNDEAQEEGQ